MRIYLIKAFCIEAEYDFYSGHVIVANNRKEVIELAKDVSAREGQDVWDAAEITLQGLYTRRTTQPYIMLSYFRAA